MKSQHQRMSHQVCSVYVSTLETVKHNYVSSVLDEHNGLRNNIALCVWRFTVTCFSAQNSNLAYNKTTSQSSTEHNGVSQNAVDGNRNGKYYGKSCTLTGKDSSPSWWQVDLEDTYTIARITISVREDCHICGTLNNFKKAIPIQQ